MPRRRLTVVQLLPALDSGGVERSTLEHASALARAGHRSVVVSSGGRLLPMLRRDGSEHVELDIGRKALSSLRLAWRLRRLFRELRPDIVLARSRFPAWLGWLALRGWIGPRPRFVTAVHGLNSPGRYSGILARGECVACVSGAVREHVLKQWPATDPRRLRVLPHGIDPAQFPAGLAIDPDWREHLAAEYPALAGGSLLLLPGRPSRRKGHDHALALLAGLRARGRDARLWLPGVLQRGHEAYVAELRVRANALRVGDAVAMTPARDDIAMAYAASDLVLQLSDQPEAFGRTVLEALAMRRPVLGWAHGGVGELLQRHFPAGAARPFDHSLLLERALGLLEKPVAVAAAIPTLEAAQARWLELYDELLA